jgi:CrcB protein
MEEALLVGCGGVVGALTRFYLGVAIARQVGAGFPFATLAINISGCFLLGLINALALDRAEWMPPAARLLIGVGFCGAYTTFSTFGYETVTLLRAGAYAQVGWYLLLSNGLGALAVFSGLLAARALSSL